MQPIFPVPFWIETKVFKFALCYGKFKSHHT